jgi:hypothetical protein
MEETMSAGSVRTPIKSKKKIIKAVKALNKRYSKGVYECPKCKNRIQVFVIMTAPPACINHRNKEWQIMTKVKS